MKRFTSSVVITAVLGLAAYSMAGAQGPVRGPGWGTPGIEGRGPGRGAGPALRGIELTDQQKEQIKAIRDAERGSLEEARTERQLHRQLQAGVFAEAPDAQALARLQQQLAEAHAARLVKQIAVDQQIAQLLTPEQRATVRERLAQAPTERPRRGPRR